MPIAVVAPAAPALRAFIRDTLGCTCPEEVFDAVVSSDLVVDGLAAGTRLVVGGRLLVYVPGGAVDGRRLAALASAGLRDRDEHGLNRFRLVIGLSSGTACSAELEDGFSAAVAGDPRAHLHGVAEADCEAVLALERAQPPPADRAHPHRKG